MKYRGGIRRWEDVGAALSVPFDGNDGRRLVREGLKVWSRPSVKGENTQQWLMTLAVEGGFPAGVLEGAEGWLSRYLLRVVVTLLQADSITPEMAFSAAEKEADSAAVPHAYQQEIFYAIAGDLASSIASLRRKAESSDRPKGITTSEWLDVIEPEWREDLPISMGEEAAVKLVNGLIESSDDRSFGGPNNWVRASLAASRECLEARCSAGVGRVREGRLSVRGGQAHGANSSPRERAFRTLCSRGASAQTQSKDSVLRWFERSARGKSERSAGRW